jgi:molecular chaperone GrpE
MLKAELAAGRADLAETRDRLLRKAAEFENYRKRTERERAEAASLAKSSVLLEFLPVADACERALNSMDSRESGNRDLEQYREGVQLLYKQIGDTLERLGVVRIAALGQKFDPHLHEALMRAEDSKHEENTVIGEVRRGYMFANRLLRPAQVKVAIRPSSKDAAES